MIEVMVTIVIVAFGLLGIASLVLRGLQAGSTSQVRSVAVSQAYDMAERMRANVSYVNSGSYNNVLPSGSSSSCSTMLAAITDTNDSTIPIVGAPSSAPSAVCPAPDTSDTTISVADQINCWHETNYKSLPSGAGAVCRDTANRWYAIIVSWDESRSGANNKSFWTIIEP